MSNNHQRGGERQERVVVGDRVVLHVPDFLVDQRAIPCEVQFARGLTVTLRPAEGAPSLSPGTPVLIATVDGGPPVSATIARVGAEAVALQLQRQHGRRAHLRHEEKVPVDVRFLGQEGADARTLSGLAVDISAGGMRVQFKTPVERTKVVFVQLRLPERGWIVATAEIAQDSERIEDDEHETRLVFTNISDDGRSRLQRYLRTR